jgi:hypothetical protein
VWRGALLLADYILSNEGRFRDVDGVELGSGPGLAGLALSCFAQRVFLTDGHEETLRLCEVRRKGYSPTFDPLSPCIALFLIAGNISGLLHDTWVTRRAPVP